MFLDESDSTHETDPTFPPTPASSFAPLSLHKSVAYDEAGNASQLPYLSSRPVSMISTSASSISSPIFDRAIFDAFPTVPQDVPPPVPPKTVIEDNVDFVPSGSTTSIFGSLSRSLSSRSSARKKKEPSIAPSWSDKEDKFLIAQHNH